MKAIALFLLIIAIYLGLTDKSSAAENPCPAGYFAYDSDGDGIVDICIKESRK